MFRLKELLEESKQDGVLVRDVAKVLFPNTSERNAYHNINNLVLGKVTRINVNDVPKLCAILGVSADYLFGMDNRKVVPTASAADYRLEMAINQAKKLKEGINELLETINY